MGMPATTIEWTVDMLDELPDDGQRYEIIDGVLYVTPGPGEAHQEKLVVPARRRQRHHAFAVADASTLDHRDCYLLARSCAGGGAAFPFSVPAGRR